MSTLKEHTFPNPPRVPAHLVRRLEQEKWNRKRKDAADAEKWEARQAAERSAEKWTK